MKIQRKSMKKHENPEKIDEKHENPKEINEKSQEYHAKSRNSKENR